MTEETIKPDKIYIITDGECSNYSILGATTDKEVADKFAEKWDARIEEFDMLKMEDFIYIQNKKTYNILMDKHGNSEPGYSYSKEDFKTEWHFWRDKNGLLKISVICWAYDYEHAVKISNEVRTQLLASGEWDRKDKEMPSHE